MKFWRINFESTWRTKTVLLDLNSVNQFDFCYRGKVIGIRWESGDTEHHLEKSNGEMMGEGDLVWTRNRNGSRFYLGRIKDSWDTPDAEGSRVGGILSTRPCKFHEVSSAHVGEDADAVFTAINQCFTSDTVQQIVTDEKLKQRTIVIWEKI